MPDETVVLFGNPNPQIQKMTAEGQVSEDAQHLSQTVTRVEFTASTFDEAEIALALSTNNDRILTAIANSMSNKDRPKYALAVHHAEQIMSVHSAGAAPSWVDCPDDAGLMKALAAHFRCAEGQPTNIVTTSGRDAHHEQLLKSSGQPAGFEYGAISPSAGTPAVGDNSLAEEYATAGSGLLRKKMTLAHSAGTNTSTLTETWTANAEDLAKAIVPTTVKLWANFNKAVSAGTMGEEDKLSSSATLTTTGDSITVTWTLTAG